MKILVTGGAGYIGSVVTELLLDSGHQVAVLDNLSRGHADAIDTRATFHQGDLLDRAFVERVLAQGFDAVCHFAALSQVGESVLEPLSYYDNNVGGAVSLLWAMRRAGLRSILFSSTAAVYGEPAVTPLTEDAPLVPVNPYGTTKLTIERLLADCGRAFGLRSLALRYFNAAGASAALGEDHRPETHLIPLVLAAALGRRGELVVYGDDYPTPDGTCVRDYIHVQDLATAHRLGLEHLRDLGRPSATPTGPTSEASMPHGTHPGQDGYAAALNLGNGTGFSVLEVIAAVETVTGRKVPYRIGPRRPGDPAVLVASSQRAEAVLGWRRRHPTLEAIIADAYRWTIKHPEGYASPGR